MKRGLTEALRGFHIHHWMKFIRLVNWRLSSFASTYSAFLVCPETLAQSLLEYLAGTALGQIRIIKLNTSGNFIARKAAPAKSN
jgi:hypothetical protein